MLTDFQNSFTGRLSKQ